MSSTWSLLLLLICLQAVWKIGASSLPPCIPIDTFMNVGAYKAMSYYTGQTTTSQQGQSQIVAPPCLREASMTCPIGYQVNVSFSIPSNIVQGNGTLGSNFTLIDEPTTSILCVDVDECTSQCTESSGGTGCINTVGSFNCTCESGQVFTPAVADCQPNSYMIYVSETTMDGSTLATFFPPYKSSDTLHSQNNGIVCGSPYTNREHYILLSSDGFDAMTFFAKHTDWPIYNSMNQKIANNATALFAQGPFAPISTNNESVWVNFFRSIDKSCANWGSSSPRDAGMYGFAGSTNTDWYNASLQSCDQIFHVYCVDIAYTEDINECQYACTGENMTCISTPGSYTCICDSPYKTYNQDLNQCVPSVYLFSNGLQWNPNTNMPESFTPSQLALLVNSTSGPYSLESAWSYSSITMLGVDTYNGQAIVDEDWDYYLWISTSTSNAVVIFNNQNQDLPVMTLPPTVVTVAKNVSEFLSVVHEAIYLPNSFDLSYTMTATTQDGQWTSGFDCNNWSSNSARDYMTVGYNFPYDPNFVEWSDSNTLSCDRLSGQVWVIGIPKPLVQKRSGGGAVGGK